MKSQSTIGRKKFILHHYIYDLNAEQSTTRHLQFISILLAVLLLTVVVVPYYMDIRPVRAAPTEITNIDGLYAIRNTLDGDYVLMNDLDFNDNDSYTGTGEQKNTKRLDNMTGDGWSPIGTSGSLFTGTFDGQNYTISNLYISSSSADYYGFFGYVDGANISNLTLANIDVTDADGRIGGLIGVALNTMSYVDNCHVTGTITSGLTGGNGRAGGLVGYTLATLTASNSSAVVDISARGEFIGGFAGRLQNAYDCYVEGTMEITTLGNVVGGFVGEIVEGEMQRCYAIMDVEGTGIVGGFGGRIKDSVVSDCYSQGNVTRISGADTAQAGFVGSLEQTEVNTCNVSRCYSTGSIIYEGGSNPTNRGFCAAVSGSIEGINNFWDNETSGQLTTGGNATAKTLVQMKTLSTFSDAGWDIVSIVNYDDEVWFIYEEEDYPRLGWEYDDYESETSFTLDGLTDSKITWYGLRGESVWCNDTGTGSETLQIQITCNLSVNVTHIDIFLADLSYGGNTLSAENVTLYVSSNNNNFGSLGAFADGGGNISINTSTWNAGTMGSDPFPIGPSESFTIYARFLLAIPSGDSPPDGTYVSTGFKVYTSGYS